MECSQCALTHQRMHRVHRGVRVPCVVQKLEKGRQKKRDALAEAEMRRSILQELQGPTYNKCECGIYLYPAWFYRHDPTKCKKCHLKTIKKQGLHAKCNTCMADLPITEFPEGNRSTCRKRVKEQKAQRYLVLKALRD